MTKITTDNVLQKVDWEPLHDKVYGRLRDALMEAQFKPGTRLSLRSIAKILGVSVMPVRAAFLRLVAEKALHQTANGQFMVPKIEQPEFDEIVFLRAELEGIAAELAATRRSTAQVAELKSIAKKLTRAAEANDAPTYLRLNRDFKFTVVRAAMSPVLHDLVESLWMRVGPFMSHYAKDIRHQIKIDRHDDVVAAVVSGEPAIARDAMARDIVDGAAFLREAAGFEPQSE